MNSLRICLVSSEVAPLAKTGGLADVAAGLSRHLAGAGHDVRLFVPLYGRIRQAAEKSELGGELDGGLAGGLELVPMEGQQGIELTFGDRRLTCSIQTASISAAAARGPSPSSAGGTETHADIKVYFVDCPELFDREDLYTSDADEHVRFGLFCRATIESCQRMEWGPDIFHCNDWHTGLLPLYLRTAYAWDRLFANSKTLLTIHNIGYQGSFGAGVLHDLGLMEQRRHLPQDDLHEDRVNFLKTGILHADALTTVSRTYAQEIQTAEFGMGLQHVLRDRHEVLHGIVNGVDYGDWNPATDPLIPHHYTPEDLSGKSKNKKALLEGFDLEHDPQVPVFGIVSRLTGQKGFDLLPDILPVILQNYDLRIVVLGSGETDLERYFQWLRDTYTGKVAIYRGYNNELAHRIEAGADVFLMPSRYEPCGLNQMYSLKYGTVPIVRRTGGLADTVEPFDPRTGHGTGFVFDQFQSEALYHTIRHALSVWTEPEAWAKMVQNGMAKDFSWDRQGKEYETLYETIRAQ